MEKKYLTESSLIKFLRTLDQDGICNKNFKPYKFRPDFVSEKLKLVVEFDGYLHYTKSKTCLDDIEKDSVFRNEDYSIIRIPYFVQLDHRVMNKLFGKYISETFDYVHFPHGFVDEKAVLPADFCSLGIERFNEDLEKFGYIKNEILESMHRLVKNGKRYHEVFIE